MIHICIKCNLMDIYVLRVVGSLLDVICLDYDHYDVHIDCYYSLLVMDIDDKFMVIIIHDYHSMIANYCLDPLVALSKLSNFSKKSFFNVQGSLTVLLNETESDGTIPHFT